MIYKTIDEWFAERINELNETLPEHEKINQITGTFKTDLLPANLMDNSYLVKPETIIFQDNESAEISASVTVQFHFRLYKRAKENYKKNIDDKLFALMCLLAGNESSGLEYNSNGITLANLHNLSITETDKSYKAGEYIFPKLKFNLQIFININ
ncbi:MAG: hypothetical protein IT280_06325 [Ignavibacteria bacterium]|nr:hypothetical protein [Ignavibacteria bacterium]